MIKLLKCNNIFLSKFKLNFRFTQLMSRLKSGYIPKINKVLVKIAIFAL